MEHPTTQKDSSKMNTVRRAGLFILLFGLGLLFWSVPAHSENAVVVRVIDGDTITVQIAGAIRTIRLIGVDTPETKHPTKAVQPLGPEASAFTQAASEQHLSRPQLNALSDGEGSVLISSSRSVEPSLILGRDSTSLFTKHLANGLLGHGGHDGDGFVRVFDLFNYVAIEVRHDAPEQSPVYAAYHQNQNFAVACCVDAARRKTRTPLTEMAADGDRLQAITSVFCSLYPLGPTDQAIWERAGGDLSRLTLRGQGRTDWFSAIKLMDRGGGSLTIEVLCREALSDYPRNGDLERLLTLLRSTA